MTSSGKTTALAASMLGRRRGRGAGGAFAGSYTLLGWQQIVRHLQWAPHGEGFPPHTTAADRRTPALLHVALRTEHDAVADMLYTDVPGEWYRAWAYDENALPSTTWIAQQADAFLLFADSDAFSGKERGAARGDYDALARRVASVASGRTVVPVLTKADVDVSVSMREHIETLNAELFDAETLPISVKDGVGNPITAAVDAGTTAALARVQPPVAEPRHSTDTLLAYRSPTAMVPTGVAQ